MFVAFKKLHRDAVIPARQTQGSVGLDITYVDVEYNPNSGTVILSTGLAVQPPKGYYFELHARSSLHKSGYALANSVGIIDEDYRGEIKIALAPLVNCAQNLPGVGTRVAQLVLQKNCMRKFSVVEKEELDDTARGAGGFGSTG